MRGLRPSPERVEKRLLSCPAEQDEAHQVQCAQLRRTPDRRDGDTGDLGRLPSTYARADRGECHRPGPDVHGLPQRGLEAGREQSSTPVGSGRSGRICCQGELKDPTRAARHAAATAQNPMVPTSAMKPMTGQSQDSTRRRKLCSPIVMNRTAKPNTTG